MRIEKEAFSLELFEEILPLAQRCWEESTLAKAEDCAFYGDREFSIEPDIETYQKLAERGHTLVITLRDDRILTGYVVGLLYRSWHHKKLLCGNADSIYVEQKHRSYTAVMVEKLENEMAKLGAVIIGWPVHPRSPVYELLKRLGYVGDDVVMEKRLCVQS